MMETKAMPTKWLLVSNHMNLLYMQAAGLIMPPKGFGKKYYQDTLAAYPGWIPLFVNNVPKAAIEHSVSEGNHLIPCIVTVNLSALQGKVMSINSEGMRKEISFPDELDGSEEILLIPAPLPMNWLMSIALSSDGDQKNFEADARVYNNTTLPDFNLEGRQEDLFKKNDLPWPPNGVDDLSRDTTLAAPFAAGGIMAMSFLMSNIGEVGMQTCRLAFDKETDVAQTIADPLISSLGTWMQDASEIDKGDVSIELFWGAVMKVAECRFSDQCTPREEVLSYLQASGENINDDRMKQAFMKLFDDLQTIAKLSNSTITEIFERHPKLFSRVMAMFFLRESCTDLLSFHHPLLTEPERIAAAILFAARDGWLGMPSELRGHPSSQAAIMHRMAAMAHRIDKTGLNLGSPPNRPLPLREYFSSKEPWDKEQKDAALALAREQEWSKCVQTTIALPVGDYQMRVQSNGTSIIFEGEPKTVKTEVDRTMFFEHMSTISPSDFLKLEPADYFEQFAKIPPDAAAPRKKKQSRKTSNV